MKKNYLLIFTLVFFQIAEAQNPVPNPGFENWTSGNPDGWSTDNLPFGTPITQVSPGNSGAYAAKGAVVKDTYGGILPPFLSSNDTSGNGFVVSQRYIDFQFFYETNLLNGDIFSVTVNVSDTSNSVIGTGRIDISGNATGFTQVDVAISYINNNMAATATIDFTIAAAPGISNPDTASYFIVDDLSLNGITNINNIAKAASTFQVYPIPAHDKLSIKGESGSNKPMQLALIDAAGRVVMERQSEPSGNFVDEELNLQGLVPGFYSLMMINDEKSLVKSIIIE